MHYCDYGSHDDDLDADNQFDHQHHDLDNDSRDHDHASSYDDDVPGTDYHNLARRELGTGPFDCL